MHRDPAFSESGAGSISERARPTSPGDDEEKAMTYPGYAAGPAVPPDRGFYGHLDPAPPAPAARPNRKNGPVSFGKRLLAVVVGAIGVFVVRSLLAGVDDPSVGDCARTTADSGYELVDCGTAEAQYRVVGEEEGYWTADEVRAASGLCTAFPATDAYLWEPGYRSESGTLYCAERI
jgi:hypothetical protein